MHVAGENPSHVHAFSLHDGLRVHAEEALLPELRHSAKENQQIFEHVEQLQAMFACRYKFRVWDYGYTCLQTNICLHGYDHSEREIYNFLRK